MRLSAVLAVAALVVAIPLATDATSLRSLYNSRVVRVELVTRPILSSGNVHTGLPHAGVRLTLEDGSQWLVHKGPDYGGSGGDTVVTSASHMSGNWNVIRSKDVHGTRVGQYVAAGGESYSWFSNNCWVAALRMYNVH